MKNHKKIISFDLDGTLVSAKFGDMVWNHGIPQEYAKRYSMDFEEAKKKVIDEYNTIGDAHLLWYDIAYWIDRFNLSVSPEELLKRYEDYIVTANGVKEILERLKEKYKLIVASNAARVFVEKELNHTGLTPYFDRIISATSDYGIVKKDEYFYKKMCLELNTKPEELVHIGDHPVFDYKAPVSIGMEAYLYRSKDFSFGLYSGEEVPENTISSLEELLEIL